MICLHQSPFWCHCVTFSRGNAHLYIHVPRVMASWECLFHPPSWLPDRFYRSLYSLSFNMRPKISKEIKRCSSQHAQHAWINVDPHAYRAVSGSTSGYLFSTVTTCVSNARVHNRLDSISTAACSLEDSVEKPPHLNSRSRPLLGPSGSASYMYATGITSLLKHTCPQAPNFNTAST